MILSAFVLMIWSFAAFALMAQTTNSVPAMGGGVSLGAFGSAQFYIDVGTLFIGAVLTAALKKWGPDIPKSALPYIATFLGFVAGALATVTVGAGYGGPMDVFKTVVLALGNVTLRELKDRIKPAEPPTP